MNKNLRDWCENTWLMIYRYAYGFVQNREEAEDITQETFTRALNKSPSPDNLPSSGYLRTIALNIVRDLWRRAKTRGTLVPFEEYMLSTNSLTESVILQNLVQESMAQLPEDYRTVLRLRIIEGYSRYDTAKFMERSEDSIRGLQYRAVQALKIILDKNLEGG